MGSGVFSGPLPTQPGCQRGWGRGRLIVLTWDKEPGLSRWDEGKQVVFTRSHIYQPSFLPTLSEIKKLICGTNLINNVLDLVVCQQLNNSVIKIYGKPFLKYLLYKIFIQVKSKDLKYDYLRFLLNVYSYLNIDSAWYVSKYILMSINSIKIFFFFYCDS